MSYFSQFRQNIATMNQLLSAAYITIVTALFREVIVILNIINHGSVMKYESFLHLNIVINCILIPSYWIYSTRLEYPEFWSSKTLFWSSSTRVSIYQPTKSIGFQLVPRRPGHQGQSTYFKTHPTIVRKFSYGFKIQKPLEQAKDFGTTKIFVQPYKKS